CTACELSASVLHPWEDGALLCDPCNDLRHYAAESAGDGPLDLLGSDDSVAQFVSHDDADEDEDVEGHVWTEAELRALARAHGVDERSPALAGALTEAR